VPGTNLTTGPGTDPQAEPAPPASAATNSVVAQTREPRRDVRCQPNRTQRTSSPRNPRNEPR